MRTLFLLIPSFLSWAAYDTNLFRKRQDSYALTAIEISLDELSQEQKLKRRQLLRQNKDVIPKWVRDQKKPEISKCNYFSTRPRDVRFSNQRKIRRMSNIPHCCLP